VTITNPLDRLFATAQQIEQEERDAAQDRAGTPEAAGDPPVYRCRVCGLESTERAYCPECLADTMVAIKARAAAPR
jgi:hypothetical protein